MLFVSLHIHEGHKGFLFCLLVPECRHMVSVFVCFLFSSLCIDTHPPVASSILRFHPPYLKVIVRLSARALPTLLPSSSLLPCRNLLCTHLRTLLHECTLRDPAHSFPFHYTGSYTSPSIYYLSCAVFYHHITCPQGISILCEFPCLIRT